MQKIIRSTLFVALIGMFLLCCSQRDGKTTYDEENESLETTEEVENKYPDGTYCAEVTYYNPNTGKESHYLLAVEVENNEIIKIEFPNGGWMDTDHFNNAELDDNGSTSFTSDKGYDYEIQIVDASGDC